MSNPEDGAAEHAPGAQNAQAVHGRNDSAYPSSPNDDHGDNDMVAGRDEESLLLPPATAPSVAGPVQEGDVEDQDFHQVAMS